MQEVLARAAPPPWRPEGTLESVGGCFACFRPPAGGGPDAGWAGAVMLRAWRPIARAVVSGDAPAGYEPGLLALREGQLLEAAVRALSELPQVLLVNATGRDHPRRAGLALHLGAVLGVPTVGVTERPLAAAGDPPAFERWATSPLVLNGEIVGFWMRTRSGVRPVAVHAGWRTDPATALEVVGQAVRRHRTPEPIRSARRLARRARSAAA